MGDVTGGLWSGWQLGEWLLHQPRNVASGHKQGGRGHRPDSLLRQPQVQLVGLVHPCIQLP